jgi:hypothetical protein
MNLSIIGNGFDLYHGIHSKYTDFANFFEKIGKASFLVVKELLSAGYSESCAMNPDSTFSSDLWSSFESMLGYYSQDAINQYRNNNHIRGEYWRNAIIECKKCFHDWGISLSSQLASTRALISDKYTQDSIFLTFNYTLTLERVYKINPQRILHIHGSANDPDSIIFGHGRNPSRPLTTEARDYWDLTLKNTEKIIRSYDWYFKGLKECDIQDIYVLGFSLSDVDKPYIRKILSCVPKATWHVSIHYDEGIPMNKALQTKQMIGECRKCKIKDVEIIILNDLS